ncbi:MAG: ATP-binding protein, partial [Myxococcota bacterium]
LEHMPVIVFTADGADRSSDIMKRGVQDYLTKGGFEGEALMRSVRYAIDRQNASTLKQRVQHESRFASLGRLAASMAHEINNPNTVVTSNLSLMEEVVADWEPMVRQLKAMGESYPPLRDLLEQHVDLLDTDDMHDMIRECLGSVQRVTDIVRQLRMLGRINPSERSVPVDLNELVRHASLIAEGQIPRHAQHTHHLTDGLPVVQGQRSRLAQMITHLMLNAAQALKEDGLSTCALTVTTARFHNTVTLSIADTGPGIPPEVLPSVFDPFFTTRPLGEGLGLGLAIVQEVVREHGGSIQLQSQLGEGTEAIVTLPFEP